MRNCWCGNGYFLWCKCEISKVLITVSKSCMTFGVCCLRCEVLQIVSAQMLKIFMSMHCNPHLLWNVTLTLIVTLCHGWLVLCSRSFSVHFWYSFAFSCITLDLRGDTRQVFEPLRLFSASVGLQFSMTCCLQDRYRIEPQLAVKTCSGVWKSEKIRLFLYCYTVVFKNSSKGLFLAEFKFLMCIYLWISYSVLFYWPETDTISLNLWLS